MGKIEELRKAIKKAEAKANTNLNQQVTESAEGLEEVMGGPPEQFIKYDHEYIEDLAEGAVDPLCTLAELCTARVLTDFHRGNKAGTKFTNALHWVEYIEKTAFERGVKNGRAEKAAELRHALGLNE